MLQAIESQLFRKIAPFTIKYIKRPDLNTKDPLVKNVIAQAAREFQVAPPVTLHQADPVLLAGVWGLMREAFVINASERVTREAVAAAVSELNQCPYCVDVHTSMHKSAGSNKDILKGELGSGDSKEAIAYQWASASLTPDSKLIKHSQISENDKPQFYATAICFHYINRMVNIFLDETPMPMPAANSQFMRKLSLSSLQFFGKRMVQLDGTPGEFLFETDNSLPLPEEFIWTKDNADIAGSLSRFSYAAEKAGKESLHSDVRALVTEHLNNWNGEAPGLGQGWLNDLINTVDIDLRPSAKLTLLSARASWQIDKKTINDFRSKTDNDKALIQATGWASYMAVKRIASWLK